MTKQIEIAPYANVDLDYKPLFNELNQFFTDYKNMVNKRLAFNKKREDAESDESIEISNTTAIEESNEETLHHATEKVNTDEVEKHRRKDSFNAIESCAIVSY